MTQPPVFELLGAARDGARHAFLTKPGGTRYGAAVWTSSGRIHRSGQYSSFNHSTNIHAEMGALAIAVAAGDADVIALALVSTSCIDWPARPCGVCRQVILEHARRVGRPIAVFMSSWDGSVVEQMSTDALLPAAWENRSTPRPVPWCAPDPPSACPLSFGDQVEVRPGVLGIVWHPSWCRLGAWVKVKYDGARKLPHSYSQWSAYQRELSLLGLGIPSSWGDRLVLVDAGTVPRIPRQPLSAIGIQRVRALVDVLRGAGVPSDRMSVTGSYAAGFASSDSDIDLVIDATASDVEHARFLVARAIVDGELLAPPSGSSTWARLGDGGLDPMALVRSGRFADTFTVRESGARVSLIWIKDVPAQIPGVRELPTGQKRTVCGSVARMVAYAKPTVWELRDESGATHVIETWHKDGMLLKQGDSVEASGIKLEGDARLFQFNPDRDFIHFRTMIDTR